VLVETEAGQVDGRLESRLERFRAALAQAAA
jgi:flagellar biosynthesis/type III secretory pathway protein FliH